MSFDRQGRTTGPRQTTIRRCRCNWGQLPSGKGIVVLGRVGVSYRPLPDIKEDDMERLYRITDHARNKWFTALDHYGDGKEFVCDVMIIVAGVCAILAGVLWGVS